ncbi:MAG: 1-acyl-sn-glycerol-3-phosphate acyltransferase [Clostridiales bacterium]|nr:1-acyl-sn-glycerol-3-phosphate acyltransferase [Clostridiales bacterium]
MRKNKKWTKTRHRVICKLLKPIFKLYFRLRYNLKVDNYEKNVPQGALIMCNHLTTLDPFMLASSFSRPIYFIASDDLFTIPIISSIIKWLVAPIPKSKSKSDLLTIKNTLKVLREGGTVAVFPEGNRTLSGGTWEIDISTAKLAKMAKVPLVLYNLKGGYGADPRWGRGVRRGKITCGVVKVLSAQQIEKMTVEELYAIILEKVVSNDYDLGIKFKSRVRAEYLERALYYCPKCKSFNTLYSKKEKLLCKNCDLSVEYTEDLKLKPINGQVLGGTVKEWFDAQRVLLKEYAAMYQEDLFADKKLKARIIYDKKRHDLGRAEIIASNYGVKIRLKNGELFDLKFEDLYGVTILGKRKINFYLPDGKTLQLKGSKRFNSVKYLHLYEFITEATS